MLKQAPIITLLLSAACGPTSPAPEPIEEPPAGTESSPDDSSEGIDEPDDGSSSDGAESTGGGPECLLEAAGRPCLDVVEYLALCDELEPRLDCSVALGRLLGSAHLAGAWAVSKPDSQECAELEGEAGCALPIDATVADCVEATECSHEAGPATCAALPTRWPRRCVSDW